jgi:hypothetical protein
VTMWCSKSPDGRQGSTLELLTTKRKSASSLSKLSADGAAVEEAALPALKVAADNPEGIFTSAAPEAGFEGGEEVEAPMPALKAAADNPGDTFTSAAA